jgi:hypothetical protein
VGKYTGQVCARAIAASALLFSAGTQAAQPEPVETTGPSADDEDLSAFPEELIAPCAVAALCNSQVVALPLPRSSCPPGQMCSMGSYHCSRSFPQTSQMIVDWVKSSLARPNLRLVHLDSSPSVILAIAGALPTEAVAKIYYRVRVVLSEEGRACDATISAYRVSVPKDDPRPARWQTDSDALTFDLVSTIERRLGYDAR